MKFPIFFINDSHGTSASLIISFLKNEILSILSIASLISIIESHLSINYEIISTISTRYSSIFYAFHCLVSSVINLSAYYLAKILNLEYSCDMPPNSSLRFAS